MPSRPHVVVATALMGNRATEELTRALDGVATLQWAPVPFGDARGPGPLDPAWAGLLAEGEVLIGFPEQFDDLFDRAPRLRWVLNFGAGVDRVDLGSFRRAGVGLVTAAGVGAPGVAEFAVGALLALVRRFPERFEAQQRAEWLHLPTGTVNGQQVTVLGMGEIGSRVVAMLHALGAGVRVVRHTPTNGGLVPDAAVFGYEELGIAATGAHALVVAAPLTGETRGIVDAAVFDAMADGAYVVNVARGELLDTDALVTRLRAGRLSGAWLDVFPQEPLPADATLWHEPGLIVSAHDATATAGYAGGLARRAADLVQRWLRGEALPNTVVDVPPPA